MHYSWNDTFPAGKEKEQEVLVKLKARYKQQLGREVKVWFNEPEEGVTQAEKMSQLREGDLVDELGYNWEVKFDRRAKETGNVFLEHTALNHSSSNFVVYCLLGEEGTKVPQNCSYVTTRVKLLSAIESGKFKEIHGGNFQKGGKPNMGTLLPVEKLKEISYEL